MAVFEKRPDTVHADQWFKNGDHPLDGAPEREGRVVRYYRTPGDCANDVCPICRRTFHDHGWIEPAASGTQFGLVVCPGDFIIQNYNEGKFAYGVINGAEFKRQYKLREED